MAKLYLKEFTCVRETDEFGNDSPYFLVFIGNSGSPRFNVVELVRRPEWDDNVSQGQKKQPDALVNSFVSAGKSVVIVALMEEDGSTDFAGNTLQNLRDRMGSAYVNIWNSRPGNQIQGGAGLLRAEFIAALQALQGNDDRVGVEILNVNTNAGFLPVLNINGQGGRYTVQFRIQP